MNRKRHAERFLYQDPAQIYWSRSSPLIMQSLGEMIEESGTWV